MDVQVIQRITFSSEYLIAPVTFVSNPADQRRHLLQPEANFLRSNIFFGCLTVEILWSYFNSVDW